MKNVWYLHRTVDRKPVNSVCLLAKGRQVTFRITRTAIFEQINVMQGRDKLLVQILHHI